MISVVIPVYNEEEIFSKNENYFHQLSKSAELIFVDGGSTDKTLERVARFGRVMIAPKGRAVQMNAGAKAAGRDILLFLHADAYLDPRFLGRIEEVVNTQGYIGGCFQQVLDCPGILFKWIAWTGNMRAKGLKIFYGDQGIFVRRDIFKELGGYPEVQLGEDVLFSKRLKASGKVGLLNNPIRCSPRRWLHQGIAKTFLLNIRITFGWMIGENIDNLSKCYRDIR